MSEPKRGRQATGSDDLVAVIRAHPTAVGQCARCRHLEAVASTRSIFVRCAAAGGSGDLPRYPILPVEGCPAFEVEES